MTSSSTLDKLFKYWHFDREIIILCVRWYMRTTKKASNSLTLDLIGSSIGARTNVRFRKHERQEWATPAGHVGACNVLNLPATADSFPAMLESG
jgi:hypothetical protein